MTEPGPGYISLSEPSGQSSAGNVYVHMKMEVCTPSLKRNKQVKVAAKSRAIKTHSHQKRDHMKTALMYLNVLSDLVTL